jgi:hypothetical protein
VEEGRGIAERQSLGYIFLRIRKPEQIQPAFGVTHELLFSSQMVWWSWRAFISQLLPVPGLFVPPFGVAVGLDK